MKSASLAVARGERRLSLVREPASPVAAVALPAWRRMAGAVVVVIALGTLTIAAFAWSLLA